MPVDLVFVRHGRSEGNEAREQSKQGDNSHYTDEFRARRNREWRLTDLGIEQAKAAGHWIPFGLLLAFSIDSDEEEARRSVILTPRNLGLAAAMLAAFSWFSLSYVDLTTSTLVVIAGVLMALPLALEESTGDATREGTIALTRRSLILALWALVIFVHYYYLRGQTFNQLVAVCVILPLAWRRRGRGAPDGGESSSGCSGTRCAGRCVPTCSKV